VRVWVGIKCQRLAESSDSEQSDAQTLSEGTRTIIDLEEMGVLLCELVLNVQVIKAKVDVLIADCEARSELKMISGEKFCWACGQSCNRDPFEESQNLCSFC